MTADIALGLGGAIVAGGCILLLAIGLSVAELRRYNASHRCASRNLEDVARRRIERERGSRC